VEFMLAPNKGEGARELRLAASGGELSRVMLAVKTALSSPHETGVDASTWIDRAETLIFDEIDTGIGGEVAIAVGEYLQKMGEVKQIFCVTHLAVIACRADNHLKVEKNSGGGRTLTSVIPLSYDERRNEIARMLAGGKGETALAHACELLEKYGVGR
jgi:DNA repair protein RecN (Recombination protein N)